MGGMREAQRIFGGEAPLGELLASLNATVFGPEQAPTAAMGHTVQERMQ